jgi:hypothetical protein
MIINYLKSEKKGKKRRKKKKEDEWGIYVLAPEVVRIP